MINQLFYNLWMKLIMSHLTSHSSPWNFSFCYPFMSVLLFLILFNLITLLFSCVNEHRLLPLILTSSSVKPLLIGGIQKQMILILPEVLVNCCFIKPLHLIFQHICIKLNKYDHTINFQHLTECSHKVYHSVTKSTQKKCFCSTTSETIATCTIPQIALEDKGHNPFQS